MFPILGANLWTLILSKQKNTESGFISRQGKTVEEKEKGVELCTREGSCIKKICSKDQDCPSRSRCHPQGQYCRGGDNMYIYLA
jgi:hypothetical protein